MSPILAEVPDKIRTSNEEDKSVFTG